MYILLLFRYVWMRSLYLLFLKFWLGGYICVCVIMFEMYGVLKRKCFMVGKRRSNWFVFMNIWVILIKVFIFVIYNIILLWNVLLVSNKYILGKIEIYVLLFF